MSSRNYYFDSGDSLAGLVFMLLPLLFVAMGKLVVFVIRQFVSIAKITHSSFRAALRS